MKKNALTAALFLLFGAMALGDEVRLTDGKEYRGTVIRWGKNSISFVPRGRSVEDAYQIAVSRIEIVVTDDGTRYEPGTPEWPTNRELGRDELAKLGPTAKKAPRPKGGQGRRSLDYAVKLAGERTSGYTEYHFNFPVNSQVYGHSKLSFPIDGYRAGARGEVLGRDLGHGMGRIGAELGYSLALTDPAEAMADSDWYEAPGDRWVFSATRSTSQLAWHELDLCLKLVMPVMPDLNADLLVGYRYSRMTCEITGVAGWQEWTDGTYIYRVTFDTLAGVNVLDYRVSYHLPYAALRLDVGGNIIGEAFYTPLARANDFDDHLLRRKSATSSCSGSSYGLGITAQVPVYRVRGAGTVSVGGGYRLFRVNTTGTQDQRFYGDDPSSPDDETGLSFLNIANEIKLRQNVIRAFAEYRF